MYKITDPKIDWLTLSLPFRLNPRIMSEGYNDYINEELLRLFTAHTFLQHFEDTTGENKLLWKHAGSVRPYPASLKNDRFGIVLGYGGKHEQATVWLSGTALQHLRDENELDNLLSYIVKNKLSVSRVDLAIDFLDPDATPTDVWRALVVNVDAKNRSWTDSTTGTTLTVGSRKSARYARVYRYNARPDRPYTRLEIEIKGKSAEAAVWKANNFDVQSVFWDAVKAMSLTLTQASEYSRLPKLEMERNEIATTSTRAAWLKKQVIPALRKMIEREEVTLYQIVAALSEIEAATE